MFMSVFLLWGISLAFFFFFKLAPYNKCPKYVKHLTRHRALQHSYLYFISRNTTTVNTTTQDMPHIYFNCKFIEFEAQDKKRNVIKRNYKNCIILWK